MAQDLSKIMGSVDLLKSYISLRKFENDNIFFRKFRKIRYFVRFLSRWVTYNSIHYKLLQR